jgi:hypothetical protein
VFPEQVSSDATVIEEQYRRKVGAAEVIGWYFDVTLLLFLTLVTGVVFRL